MVFGSTAFLFFFLPVVLVIYFLLPAVKSKNVWLFAASLFFYFFGGGAFLLILLYTIILNYIGGRCLEVLQIKDKERNRKIVFVGIIILNLCNLGYWKYTKFLMQTISDVTGLQFIIPDIVLPIGISFFTFQGMSYVIDVYRGDVPVQKSILKLGLYIALFPQLIAGPIVRYSDIEKQLNERTHSVDNFADGIRIFTVGLAKKAIIANSVAVTADSIFDLPSYQNTPSVAWLGLLCYILQLYMDFSGYSDMAVGLGRMFGFRFMSNFNYPYISRSASELWRRWHISLSAWFRDYVYIPLGGSRRGNVYWNLFCVFMLTGIWHGASWNYVLWGLYWSILIIAERILSRKLNWKLPGFAAWCLTMFLWAMSLVIFRAETIPGAIQYFQSLFGLIEVRDAGFSPAYYLHRYEIFMILLGIVVSLPLGRICYQKIQARVPETVFVCVQNIAALAVLGVSILYVVTGTYNPFIYFQF